MSHLNRRVKAANRLRPHMCVSVHSRSPQETSCQREIKFGLLHTLTETPTAAVLSFFVIPSPTQPMRTLKLLVMCLLALAASQAAKAGMATRLWYSGSGTSVSSMTSSPDFPLNFNAAHYYGYDDSLGGLPEELTYLRSALRDDTSWLNNYGTWTRGFLQAPQDGNYRFFIYSDDDAEFWISSSESPSGKTKVAENVGAVGRGSWAGKPAQISGLINLQRGKTYYYEVFTKEGGGDDHFGVGWQLPDGSLNRPISSQYLVPFNHVFTKYDTTFGTNLLQIVNAPTFSIPRYTGFNSSPSNVPINGQPQNISVGETLNAVIEGTVMGAQPMSFQWLRSTDGGANYQVVPGAVFQGLTITNVTIAQHDQNRFRLVASNAFGRVTNTTPAILTITPDAVRPTLISAQTFGRTNAVTLIFSEKLSVASAGNKNNYAVTNQTQGVTVLSVSFDGDRTVTLNTTPMPASGIPSVVFTVVVNNVRDVSAAANSVLPNTFASFVQVDGVINSRRYLNIGGTDIPSLTNNAKFVNGQWDNQVFKNIMESDLDSADNYGAELIGYVVPAVSGAYSFFISADDNANLFLSTDASPANKILIAREPEWNGSRFYQGADRRGDPRSNGRYVNQSDDITLVAGRAYFIQALMKEGGGGDNLSVAWQTPGGGAPANGSAPIGGANLSAFSGYSVDLTPPTLTLQPSNTVVAEGTRATFFSAASGGNPMNYQWFRDGSVIPGSVQANYSVFPARMADNGATFSVTASNLGGGPVFSTNAVLTVLPDTNQPVLVRARGSSSRREITLDFNEFLDPIKSTNVANFNVTPFLNVISARLAATGTNIVLVTDRQTEGQLYTVNVIGGVSDNSSNTNAIGSTNAQFFAWVFSKGFALRQWYENTGGGTAIANLTSAATYPDAPTRVDYLTGSLTQPQTNPDLNNFGVRITGWLKAPAVTQPFYSNFWNFFIRSDDASRLRVSTDDDPLNVTTTNVVEEAGCCNAFLTSNPDQLLVFPLSTTSTHYFEVLMKEGGGGDFVELGLWNLFDQGLVTAQSPVTPLSAAFYGVYADPKGVQVTFTSNPQSRSVPESSAVQFSASAVATNNGVQAQVAYQWQRKVGLSFVDIEGANQPNYTYPRAALADNGAVFRVQASTPGATTNSAEATITISAPDTVAPKILGLAVREDYTNNMNRITVRVNEPLTNYFVGETTYTLVATNGSGARTVSSARVANGTNLILNLSSKLAEDTWYSLTIAGARDVSAAGNILTPNSIVFRSPVFVRGKVFAMKYEQIGGGSVDNLWAATSYPNNPTVRTLFNQADFPGSNDDYGYWIRGYIVPDFDGPIMLAISSDDNSRLFFSTDETPAGRGTTVVAEEPQWNGYREFTGPSNGGGRATTRTVNGSPYLSTRTQNQSGDFNVFNGNRYYFDYYQKEGGGGDSGSVGWQTPTSVPLANGANSVIPANNLGILLDPNDWIINITTHPASTNAAENSVVNFTAAANATSVGALNETVTFQWKRNGVAIPGATGSSYQTFAAPSNHNASFSVDVSFVNAITNLLAGTQSSSNAVLTVANDAAAPALLSAARNAITLSNVNLTFSEPMLASSANIAANYKISGLTVSSAAISQDGRTVVLTASGPLMNNAVYFVTVTGLKDASTAGNNLPATTARIALNGPIQLSGGQNLGAFEAEEFDANTAQGTSYWNLSIPFSRPIPTGYSGIGVMEALPNNGLNIGDPNILALAPRLDYLVNFPTAGTYYVWVRASGPSGADDSIHIGLNGSLGQFGTNLTSIPAGSYGWATNTVGGPARVVVPSSGNHTFNIWMREDGVIVDRILLTTDAAYVPSGNGPASASRGIVAPTISLRSVRVGNNLTLSWDGAGALQGATSVTGVWNLVSTNSPVVTNTASGSSYFRLNVPLVP